MLGCSWVSPAVSVTFEVARMGSRNVAPMAMAATPDTSGSTRSSLSSRSTPHEALASSFDRPQRPITALLEIVHQSAPPRTGVCSDPGVVHPSAPGAVALGAAHARLAPPKDPPPMALTDLPVLLRDEPALLQVLGRSAAVLAVPEPARPIALAALSTVGSRTPILVAVPTTAEAERLVRRPDHVPGARCGGAVPRLGDAAVRTGQPGDRDHGTAPAHHLAAALRRRAPAPASWWRRCGRWCSGSAPTSTRPSRSWCARARSATKPRWSRGWASTATGERARWSTGASSPCGAPSSTCSAPPPTRRCASTSGATRSTGSPPSR